MKIVDFELEDAAGRPHKYTVTLFSCDENTNLQILMGDVLSGPMGSVIGAVSTAFAGRAPGAKIDLMESLAKIDWAQAGVSIQSLARALRAEGGSKIFARVLKNTIRVRYEEDATGGEHEVYDELAKSDGRDMAYGDGNYVELWKAFVAVLTVNFGPFGRDGSLSLSDALSSLTSGLITPLTPTTETTEPNTAASSGQTPQPG